MIREELQKKIRTVEPYVPGEQPTEHVIKPNTNETPYTPSHAVWTTLAAVDASDVRQ